jgi:hypothetical protein
MLAFPLLWDVMLVLLAEELVEEVGIEDRLGLQLKPELLRSPV